MAKTFEKTSAVQFTDDEVTPRFRKTDTTVEVLVDIPGVATDWRDWKDVYTAAQRTTLGPLLVIAARFELEQLGYTEV